MKSFCNAVLFSCTTLVSIASVANDWQVISRDGYSSRIGTPCPGQSIPYDESRRARNISLSCSPIKETSTYTRFPERYDTDEAFYLQQQGDREALQQFRRNSSNVSWSGTFPIQTQVQWNYTVTMRGTNGAKCGYTRIPKTCSRPKYRQDCHYVPDPEPAGGGYDGGGSGSGSDSSPSYESEGSSPYSFQKVMDFIGNAILPSAHAGQECTTVSDGTEDYDCSYDVENSCTWEQDKIGSFGCTTETVNYTAYYAKPDVKSWNPSAPSYLDILPNKYDLLPGEHETVKINISGGSYINKSVQVINAWNQYSYTTSATPIQCKIGMNQSFKARITTNTRLKRKAPNPLVLGRNERGQVRPLTFDQVTVGGTQLPGKPLQIHLIDTSAQAISDAARVSRQVDPGTAVVNAKNQNPGTFKNVGFWKDSVFRVRLIEINPRGRNITFTRNFQTPGSFVESANDGIDIPLDGSRGVPKFFRPSGVTWIVQRAFGGIFKSDNVKLTPGKTYSMRVSILQKGIPFYVSGCPNNAPTCEGKNGKIDAFSDELSIGFVANPRVDERSFLERLMSFQRRMVLW